MEHRRPVRRRPGAVRAAPLVPPPARRARPCVGVIVVAASIRLPLGHSRRWTMGVLVVLYGVALWFRIDLARRSTACVIASR